MKNSAPFSLPAWRILGGALACAAVTLLSPSARAVNYYWDDTTATDGTSTAPTGTWGTDAFFNTSATGASTGTFITAPTTADLVQFVARGTTDTTSGSGAYTVTVGGTQNALGLVFRQTGTITLGGATAGTGTINLGANGINNAVRDIGGTANNSGGVIINANLVLQAAQTWSTSNTTASQPAFTIAGNTTGTGDLTLTNGSNRAFTVNGGLNHTGLLLVTGGNGNGTVTINGSTDTAGGIGATVNGLTLNGSAANRLLLTRAAGNSYTGTTTITQGKLQITNTSGSATGTSSVALSGGSTAATLGGTGFSTGILSVTAGSRLAPGAVGNASNFGSVGTLTVGAATLTSANLDFDLASTAAAASNDRLTSTGLVTLGNVVFNFQSIGGTVSLSTTTPYTLIVGTDINTTNANFTTNFNGALAGLYTASYSVVANSLQVNFAAVPEPSTWACLALGVGWLGLVVARRRTA